MADGATKPVAILGTFVADLTFVAERLPGMAETLFGDHAAGHGRARHGRSG